MDLRYNGMSLRLIPATDLGGTSNHFPRNYHGKPIGYLHRRLSFRKGALCGSLLVWEGQICKIGHLDTKA